MKLLIAFLKALGLLVCILAFITLIAVMFISIKVFFIVFSIIIISSVTMYFYQDDSWV